ncbi:MAG: hypothetical protein M5U28_51085 [Sandaracinaceae bacterium]|nr:hypothetical protein [Sandaracinaceae bacterium]
MREAVLAACADRAAAHRAIAAALERRGGEPGEVAPTSWPAGIQAVDLAVEGARRAERRGDDEEAASLLEGALSTLRRRGEAPDRAEVELAIARGEGAAARRAIRARLGAVPRGRPRWHGASRRPTSRRAPRSPTARWCASGGSIRTS